MMKKTVALTVMLCGSLFAQDIVKNGSFSQIGSNTLPQNWQDKSMSWSVTDSDGSADTFSVQFNGAKKGKGELRQNLVCKSNTEYKLSVFFKKTGNRLPYVKILDSKNTVIASVKADAKINDEWTEYTASFKTPKTKKIYVVISAEGTDGVAKVDNISIISAKDAKKAKKAAVSNLFIPPAGAVNIALNRPYTMSRKASYQRSQDAGDAVQLTDGKFTKGHFWTQKSTVGWSKQTIVEIVVDLGKVQPIQGFMYSCAGNLPANVPFPDTINMFTSLDNKTWYYVGDLIEKSYKEVGKPDFEKYNLYRAASMNMPTKGRYVCFQIRQDPSKRYMFADEIMIFKGDDKLLNVPMSGIKAESLDKFIDSMQLATHFREDADYILKNADKLSAAQKKDLADKFNEILKNPGRFDRPSDKEFIPVLPMHKEQEKLFALNNIVLRANGYTQPIFWQNNRWDNLYPVALPPKGSTPAAVKVDMMAGEVRSESINILNPTDKVIDYKVSVEGLPANAKLSCREVLFVDTKQNIYTASALKDGQGNSVTVKIHPGMSRQIWFTLVKPDLKPGLYKATVKATAKDAPTITIPFELAISTVKFPARPRMHIGGWDYLDHGGKYYKTPGNVAPNRKMLEYIYTDCPWAKRSILPTGAKYNKEGKLLNPTKLNTKRWDKWVAMFPDARYYCIHISSRYRNSWGGEKYGSQRFQRILTEYMTAFAAHLRKTGIDPKRVVLHLVDEARNHSYDQVFINWAKAIKNSGAGFTIYSNPIYGNPQRDAMPELFEYSDILCPNLLYISGNPVALEFYRNLTKQGKQFWYYTCHGPSRLNDPVYYYRAQAWQVFDMGGDGSFFWAFGCGGGQGDSWHPYTQVCEYSPYYVSKTDVMAAKQSEGVMEGAEDFEYLAMLKDRVAELKKAGKKSADIDAAEKLITEGPRRVINAYAADENGKRVKYSILVSRIHWINNHDRSVPDQVRLEALRLLEKLQK
ncbi:MAG: hypothetical protein IKB71_03610 [Lentisphaeria bacterium]|nr:hypothetical protein [Lentisphaeria bacterium]